MSLTAKGLAKSFGGEAALAGVDLHVADGEIHALLGPNGSGKSTLIGCISGRLSPDAGSMSIGEHTARRFTPRSAFAAGTAVIYQHFSLIPSLSVADNICLGSERTSLAGQVDRKRQLEDVREVLSLLGAHLDPRSPVESLSAGNQQLVEIAKALRHGPRLLVLDEPTAALGEAEARKLGAQLRKLRDAGLAILYVTHLLSEVFEIADRVTVLRDGKSVMSESISAVSSADVVKAIAPQMESSRQSPRLSRSSTGEDAPLLELADFCAPGVGPLNLSVLPGEIVGVFGLLGSGRSELLEGLYGIRGKTAGIVRFDGVDLDLRSATRSLRRGLALVPAERLRQGMFTDMSALDNVLLPHFRKLGRPGWRNRKAEETRFSETAKFLQLKPARSHSPAWTYSGGNQQKLVVGRWLTEPSNARLLLLDEPTQGIDIGARTDLYRLIREFTERRSRGVLFTSSDPEEVEALADRVYVLARGRLIAELPGSEIVPERLLDLAHGLHQTR